MKILNLTTAIPSKYGTGADIASNHLIDAMRSLSHDVTVVGYRRWGDSYPYDKDVIEVGELHIETKAAGFYPLLWAAIALSQRLPYTSAKYYSDRYVQIVKSLLFQQDFDAIILEHSSQLYWLKSVLTECAKIAVLAHNIEHKIYQDRCKETVNFLAKRVYEREVRLVKQLEDDLATTSEGIWTLSVQDASYFTQVRPATTVQVFELPTSVTHPIDLRHPKTYDIGMVGSWIWKPNGDGLHFFFEQIYPYLPPQLSIRVAGRGAEWLTGKYDNVEYLGFVESAQQFLATAKVIAIPSICGGGVQIKTLEAIGLGLPIVATSFALRGITTLPMTVQSADDPEQFAECLKCAIAQSISTSHIESVKDWVQKRRSQFLYSVDVALKTLVNKD